MFVFVKHLLSEGFLKDRRCVPSSTWIMFNYIFHNGVSAMQTLIQTKGVCVV